MREHFILIETFTRKRLKTMIVGSMKMQGSKWDLNIAVAIYLITSNALIRWMSENKANKLLRSVYILNIFYIFGVLSNLYFLKNLIDFKEDGLLDVGILGFKLKAFGMLETLLLIMTGRSETVDPYHYMDYCFIVTFATIFAYGNSKLLQYQIILIKFHIVFSVSIKYGLIVLCCHSILKILEYSWILVSRRNRSLFLGNIIANFKFVIDLAILQQLVYHELGWNIFSMIYYAPSFGHLWFEMKNYYGMSC